MKKKKILFVNESLACAGGEKSLLTLLSLLDYDKYDVSLQLVSYGNEWDKLVDSHVKILPPIPYFEQLKRSLPDEFRLIFKKGGWKRLTARLKYAYAVRFQKNLRIQELACKFWQAHSTNIPESDVDYDVAIAYAQGFPTFFVADKIKAKKKLCWINALYDVNNDYQAYVEQKYALFSNIVAVSPNAANYFEKYFPRFNQCVSVFPDLLNGQMVQRLSEAKVEKIKNQNGLTIVTLGRLEWHTKGLDLLSGAAKELKNRGVSFKWYVFGKGESHDAMMQYIVDNNLENKVILAGVAPNPYPYIKQADIYVQTSRNEGFGIAIAEARILNIPVVSTHFETADMQLKHESNALLTDFSEESIADAVQRLYEDKVLYQRIKSVLAGEPQGNIEELLKFYDLID